jgi:LPPG:FO 2-phospho-L-lactate transferase
MITVLAGGVGAARFLRGLVTIVPPEEIVAVVNVGDDIVLHGLRICPDLDSVVYTLGGRVHPVQQWGRDDEQFAIHEELSGLGDETWFTLGDRDLALHIHRTARLAGGEVLSEVTDRVRLAHGVATTILPATDDPLTTRIVTTDGHNLHFQEWWVRERALPDVSRIDFHGAGPARPAPGVVEAIRDADIVIVAPSNPVVSVAPIRAIGGIATALSATTAPIVGVSPIVGGQVLRGMAHRLLPAVGAVTSALGVAEWYGARSENGLLDGWIIDTVDRQDLDNVRSLGISSMAVDTIMDDPEVAAQVATACLELAEGLP